MVSRHETARGCWLEKEESLEKKLEGLSREKVEAASELSTLTLHLEALKEDLQNEKTTSKDQSTKVA